MPYQSAVRHSSLSMLAQPARRRLKTVRHARVGIEGGFFFHENAARGIAMRPAPRRAGEEQTVTAQVVGTERAERGVEEAAAVDEVERADRLRARPCRLPIEREERAMTAVDTDIDAQVGLRAAVGVEVLAPAPGERHRRGPDLRVPLGVYAQGDAGIQIVDAEPLQQARFARFADRKSVVE